MIAHIEMGDPHVSATLRVSLGAGLIRPEGPISQTVHDNYDRAILDDVNSALRAALRRQNRYAVEVIDTDDAVAWVLIEATAHEMVQIVTEVEKEKS